MSTDDTRPLCAACGEPLSEPYPAHRRWRCREVSSRMDIRDAAQAAGLPRDTALWKLLDVVAQRATDAERARHAALVAAARLALDLLPDLSVAYHQTGSIRDHADPKDRTGWNVHGIETCDDPYCEEGLAAIAALRVALASEEAPCGHSRIINRRCDYCGTLVAIASEEVG